MTTTTTEIAAPETVTKKEAAEILGPPGGKPLSNRTIERYVERGDLHVHGEAPGKTRSVVLFLRSEVLELKERQARQAEEAARGGSTQTGLTASKRDSPQSVAVVATLAAHLEAQREMGERLAAKMLDELAALRTAVDTRPVWLTREQALEVSGMPGAWLQQAIRDGHLNPIGKGRGWRLNRDELLAFSRTLGGGEGDHD